MQTTARSTYLPRRLWGRLGTTRLSSGWAEQCKSCQSDDSCVSLVVCGRQMNDAYWCLPEVWVEQKDKLPT